MQWLIASLSRFAKKTIGLRFCIGKGSDRRRANEMLNRRAMSGMVRNEEQAALMTRGKSGGLVSTYRIPENSRLPASHLRLRLPPSLPSVPSFPPVAARPRPRNHPAPSSARSLKTEPLKTRRLAPLPSVLISLEKTPLRVAPQHCDGTRPTPPDSALSVLCDLL